MFLAGVTFALLLLLRAAYLVLTLFLTTDIQRWVKGLLPPERKLIRWLSSLGLDEEGKADVIRMRERMKRGLPPF